MLPDQAMDARIIDVMRRRMGCWCYGRVTMCPEHDAYDDGWVAGYLVAEKILRDNGRASDV